MINRVVLVGRITRELEIRRSTSGVAILPFTLAIDSVRKDPQGNRMTNFIPCRALGNIAETIEKYCTKGSLIAVEGYIESSRYERRDGTSASSLDVFVQAMTLCDNRKNTQRNSEDSISQLNGNTSGYEPDTTENETDNTDYSQMDLADDDLPF